MRLVALATLIASALLLSCASPKGSSRSAALDFTYNCDHLFAGDDMCMAKPAKKAQTARRN